MENDKKRYEVCQGENPVLSDVVPDTTRQQRGIDMIAQAVGSFSTVSDPNKWHIRFLMDAYGKAKWSKDPSTKCGAVIIDQKQRIISSGYNGFPRGIKDTEERLSNRDLKYALTIHAEMNAILFSKVPLDGFTLYSVPLPPCVRCAVQIIQSGISTVVSVKMTPEIEERWGESVKISKELFEEAGIEYIELEL